MKKLKVIASVGVAVALSMGCFGCTASSTEKSEAASQPAAEELSVEGTYVSIDWLKENLDKCYIVDARSSNVYYASHIPGAVNAHWTSLSNVTVKQGEAGWAGLLSGEEMAQKLAAEGITNDRPIVVYTKVQDGWGEDGRIMWTLQEAGFDNIHILDGGWTAWIGAGGETEGTSVTSVESTTSIKSVSTKYVKKAIAKKKATIVDARMETEYSGETNMGEKKMGHIPGAVNVPNTSLYDKEGKIKSDEELAEIFKAAGLDNKDAEIITYCTGGVRAANVAEVLTAQGYTNVKVYTCSFAEWAGTDNKVVK